MMRANRRSGSGSGPFLMEMLVVVGFFILCSAVCISVFVKADRISREARDMNQAVLMAESLAESIKTGQAILRAQGVEAVQESGGADGGSGMLPDRDIWEHLARADELNPGQAQWLRELEDSEGYEGMYTFYWDSLWQTEAPSPAPPYLGVVRTGMLDQMRRTDILIMRYGNGGDKGSVLYRLQTETYEAP